MILVIRLALLCSPFFVNRKLEQDFRPNKPKPSVVNQQCAVYHFSCDRCNADYVSYTTRHLFQHVAEHKYSAIGKHLTEALGGSDLLNESLLKFLRNSKASLIAQSLKCFPSRDSNII